MSDIWLTLPYKTSSILPSNRENIKLSYYNNKIYIFGGISTIGRTNNIFYYDLIEKKWNDIISIGSRPPPRSGHSLIKYNNKLWIYGGEGKFLGDHCTNLDPTKRQIYGDIYSFDLTNNCFDFHTGCGTPPENLLPIERRNHSAICIIIYF